MDNINNGTDTLEQVDELSVLKNRARLMGIQHSPNIGIQALRQKIEAKLAEPEEVEAEAETEGDEPEAVEAVAPKKKVSVHQQIRQQQLDEQLALVRCRITNLDPKKKDLPGEIITVANEYVGTVRKYVPFGEVTDEGYHIPLIIYNFLKARKFVDIRTTKDAKGQPVVKHRWAQEFAIEVLPQLTQEELNKLAAAQAAAGLFQNDGLDSL